MAQGKKTVWTKEQIAKIEELALLGCRSTTIARALGIDERTLRDNFTSLMQKKWAEYRVALRRGQHARAIEDRDTGMLCFLGKNDLGQADRHEITHEAGERLGSFLDWIKGRDATEDRS